MRKRKPLFHRLSVRVQWMDRRLRRSWVGRCVRKIDELPGRLVRWWSLFSLRLSWGKFFVECGSVACLLCLGGLSFLFVSHFVFQSIQVIGPSMYPTLINSDFYWVDRLAYDFHDPRRGDIVAIKDPSNRGFDVKRVIALPNQSIYLRNGKVYINGQALREPYLPARMHTYSYGEKTESEFWCLSPNQYFVMGDNRGNSCDSRTFGPIPRASILGKIIR